MPRMDLHDRGEHVVYMPGHSKFPDTYDCPLFERAIENFPLNLIEAARE